MSVKALWPALDARGRPIVG